MNKSITTNDYIVSNDGFNQSIAMNLSEEDLAAVSRKIVKNIEKYPIFSDMLGYRYFDMAQKANTKYSSAFFYPQKLEEIKEPFMIYGNFIFKDDYVTLYVNENISPFSDPSICFAIDESIRKGVWPENDRYIPVIVSPALNVPLYEDCFTWIQEITGEYYPIDNAPFEVRMVLPPDLQEPKNWNVFLQKIEDKYHFNIPTSYYSKPSLIRLRN